MSEIRVAIVGVGNCASALVQGLHYYRNAKSEDVVGLMHPNLGGYRVSDVVPVVALDVDVRKVGKDLSEAIITPPNCTVNFCDVPKLEVEVMMGPVMDGLGRNLKEKIEISDQKPVNVAEVLRGKEVDILVNLMPAGSKEATRFYADQAIKEAEIGFVNGIPELIVSTDEYAREAEKHGVAIVGDDFKSQVGGSALHRALVKLFLDRGVRIKRTYQVNFGGNTDFYNMLERSESKHTTKVATVKSIIPYDLQIDAGPSGYINFLKDNKVCYLMMQGEGFGGIPITIRAELNVVDSPNAAGVLIDMIRCCKIGLDRGVSGPLLSASAYFAKNPPQQFPDDEAKRMVDEFIGGKRER